MLDLCQIIWGRHRAQYELEFVVNENNQYTVFISRDDDNALDNPLHAVENCASTDEAWMAVDEQLTEMATEIMAREWHLAPDEIEQIFNGPRGGLMARFDYILEDKARRQLEARPGRRGKKHDEASGAGPSSAMKS